MVGQQTYTDEELTAAVSRCHSWRGVLRELGLSGTSSRAIACARAQADHLDLDYSHFHRQFRWQEGDLRKALGEAHGWPEALRLLGLMPGSLDVLKGHALRLGIDVSHLDGTAPSLPSATESRPCASHLRRAGPLLAAAWFILCGDDVSWPLEPARYDLVVDGDAGMRRIQVKTTTVRTQGGWKVYLSTTGKQRRTYKPDEIDAFFVIDGSLGMYLIPFPAVGGRQAVHLSAYEQYRLPPFPTSEHSAQWEGFEQAAE
ncbi:hypothetical protein SAMN05216184_101642 [Georgenia satyanarayanai]|uniref:PD(D/E)XK endonuclease domain-containing protein n=1 Tax=Georgenia satyanarayanai TaxID=860221 RepID=A0A2Y9A3A5_9MICO|nr:group I intron-associated PD-(D/E)XK endonuclease [Georgenia satyanarayanai]PYG02171.1 hypothetical protein A8987_101642 [Georgenia satyanarayanai]SSA36989.1 hypothetical protein SAMN05216184_101642 [Georgenia satyanarayanai]